MYKKQDKNSMTSWSTNFIITIMTHGDRVVGNFGCVIIVIMKFVDQDIIEFIYIYIPYVPTVHH